MNWIDLIKRSVKKYYFNNYESESSKTELLHNDYMPVSKNLEEFLICSNPYFTLNVIDKLGGIDAKEWAEELKQIYVKIFGPLDMIPCENFYKISKEVGRHKFIRHKKGKRQTSICEVFLSWEKDFEIEVNIKDIEFKSSTSSGPGGQNRDKGNSKSQIIYKPLNIVLQEEGSRNLLENHQKNLLKLKLIVINRMKKDIGEGLLQKDNMVRIYEYNNKLYIPSQPGLSIEEAVIKSISS